MTCILKNLRRNSEQPDLRRRSARSAAIRGWKCGPAAALLRGPDFGVARPLSQRRGQTRAGPATACPPPRPPTLPLVGGGGSTVLDAGRVRPRVPACRRGAAAGPSRAAPWPRPGGTSRNMPGSTTPRQSNHGHPRPKAPCCEGLESDARRRRPPTIGRGWGRGRAGGQARIAGRRGRKGHSHSCRRGPTDATVRRQLR